jgi:DNA-binding response OmpR family regulator
MKILLVEDNPDDAWLMLRYLAIIDRAAYHVSTLAEALAYVLQSPPDLVLLDLGLPDSAGADTYLKMRQATSAKIVVVSGWVTDDLIAQAIIAGVSHYVGKDQMTADLLLRIISEATGGE